MKQVVLLLFMSVIYAAPSVADATKVIEDQTLRYAVTFKKRNVGKVKVIIRNKNDGYMVTSTAKPSAMASLFVKAHLSDTHFVRRHGVVILDRGTEGSIGEDDDHRHFYFDHVNRQIKFSDRESYTIQSDDQFEAAAFPLLLMLRSTKQISGVHVHEVSAKRTRAYTYEPPVEEIVKLPIGKFLSWKVRRHRSDRPADNVTVWLSKSEGVEIGVPLKIVVRKRGKASALLLTGLSSEKIKIHKTVNNPQNKGESHAILPYKSFKKSFLDKLERFRGLATIKLETFRGLATIK